MLSGPPFPPRRWQPEWQVAALTMLLVGVAVVLIFGLDSLYYVIPGMIVVAVAVNIVLYIVKDVGDPP